MKIRRNDNLKTIDLRYILILPPRPLTRIPYNEIGLHFSPNYTREAKPQLIFPLQRTVFGQRSNDEELLYLNQLCQLLLFLPSCARYLHLLLTYVKLKISASPFRVPIKDAWSRPLM